MERFRRTAEVYFRKIEEYRRERADLVAERKFVAGEQVGKMSSQCGGGK